MKLGWNEEIGFLPSEASHNGLGHALHRTPPPGAPVNGRAVRDPAPATPPRQIFLS